MPRGTKELYENSSVWNGFQNIEEFNADIIPGDVNGDGEITVADANSVVVIINGGGSGGHSRIPNPNGGFWINLADANNDGEVNIADVNTIIDLILMNKDPFKLT